ncbi:MAG: GspH/FimT family pseudopilin [Rhodoferax sp.]|nr:GspH/FimT family pseudopilin [Rhodoferax sp.]
MQTLHRQSGMTLIELMVALAILGILLAIGIPSLQAMSETEAVRGHVNTFFSTLRYARSEAIRNRAQVVICPSASSESASPSCTTADTARWHQGWIVFVNRDGDSSYSYDVKKDTLLRVQGAITNSGGIEKISGATPNKLVYRNTGILLTGGTSSFTFDATSTSERQRKRVCISMQGRARISASLNACT